MKRINLPISLTITLLLAALLAIFAVFSILMNSILSDSYTAQGRNITFIENTQDFRQAIIESQNGLTRYLATENIYKLSEHLEAEANANAILSGIGQFISSDDEASYLYQAMLKSLEAYSKTTTDAYNMFANRQNSYYQKKQEADLIASYLLSYADQLLAMTIADDIDALNSNMHSSRTLMLLNVVFLLFFVGSLLATISIFSSKLRMPLNKLVKQAEMISQSHFDARTELSDSDPQVALLSSTFNRMAEDIDKMMQDLRDKVDAEERLLEEKKKNLEYEAMLDKATFLALQTQTNPHFLYNTLNSIDRTIQLGNTDAARLMLKSLSDLMRYNLSNGDIPAILAEELEITEKYLIIQKMRFSERLEYTIEADEDIAYTTTLPRFTLQPLVENAIIHGLTPKEKGGHLRITAHKDGDHAVIMISDDGIGMDASRLAELASDGHIGIANTKKRLEIFEGRDDVFSISSERGKGTVITIRLGGGNEQESV